MRVFELAQSLKTTGADLLRRAQSLKLDVHSPLARLDDDDIKALREHLAQHPSEDDVASQAKLAAKRKRVRERQAADREREAAALNETVARAKRIEETVLGKSLPV